MLNCVEKGACREILSRNMENHLVFAGQPHFQYSIPLCAPFSILFGISNVIIEKSRGEVSPMGQDTIENVS